MKYRALITGANSDIGYKTCSQYLESGCEVIALCHKSRNKLDSLISKYGENIQVFSVDLMNSDNLTDFIAKNDSNLRSVNIFVHLAAVREVVEYGNITADNLIDHFSANVVSSVLLTQFLVKTMNKKLWGRIVIGSSTGVKFGGGIGTYCYSLTKYASEFMPNSFRQWAGNNVLINAVRIGVTSTRPVRELGEKINESRMKLIPMKRFAQPDEIAKEIYHLGSKDNTYITGQVITISGGE